LRPRGATKEVDIFALVRGAGPGFTWLS
jgi:hypothetical protein